VPEGQLLFYREAELKHGRVCMLAMLGLVVGDRHDFFPILGGGVDKAAPAYLLGTPAIMQTSAAEFWKVAFAAIFFEEYRRNYYNKQDVLGGTQPSAPAPGDYGWDPLGLKPKNAKDLKELQTKELNNGRLAMFAAAGWIAQEQLFGKKIWPFLKRRWLWQRHTPLHQHFFRHISKMYSNVLHVASAADIFKIFMICLMEPLCLSGRLFKHQVALLRFERVSG